MLEKYYFVDKNKQVLTLLLKFVKMNVYYAFLR